MKHLPPNADVHTSKQDGVQKYSEVIIFEIHIFFFQLRSRWINDQLSHTTQKHFSTDCLAWKGLNIQFKEMRKQVLADTPQEFCSLV